MHNLEYEKAILGAVKIDNSIIDILDIDSQDFFHTPHQKIFTAMKTIIETGYAIDNLSLVKYCPDIPASYIADLEAVTSGNVKFYEETVISLARKRKLFNLSLMIKDSLKVKTSAETLKLVDEELLKIQNKKQMQYHTGGELLIETVNDVEKKYNGEYFYGYKTGYSNLDEAIEGLKEEELMIIAARSSIGKTTFMLNIASNISRDHPIGIFSCEMNGKTIMDKLVCINSSLTLRDMKTGKLTKDKMDTLMVAANDIRNRQIFIDDEPNISLDKIQAKARRMKREGVKVIFIDYLTLIKYENRNMQRPERIGHIIKIIKQLARDLKIPIVVLSQLNRECEGKAPTLANIRQSGEIEEDADIILFMFRKRNEDKTIITIAKNRNGPCCQVQMIFDRETGKIKESYGGSR